ncbi:MAG: hypothetical protein DSO04_05860 [Hadesarchaea archaeon]|nr:MAG: hypothetical protein DSO04_05860 [Hadesarchaea archaeon]
MIRLTGSVVFQYFYDCGGEVNLSLIPAEKLGLVEQRPRRRMRILAPRYEHLGLIPLMGKLGEVEVDGHRMEVEAKIFPVGAIEISLILRFEKADVDSVVGLVGMEERKVKSGGEETRLEEIAKRYFENLRKKIRRAIVLPYQEFERPETYTLILLSGSDPPLSASDFLTKFRKHTAGLLRGEVEWRSLSRKEVDDALRAFLSYSNKDVLFVDWYSALIYEQEGYVDDYVRMIELAKIQLLELKTYDSILDLETEKAYNALRAAFPTKMGVRWRSRSYRELMKTASELAELRVEIMEYVGDLRNILKYTGEWYLGKIYRLASERFRISDWLSLVDKKLDQLQELYAMTMERVDAQHAASMEFLSVLLIAAIVLLEVMMIILLK